MNDLSLEHLASQFSGKLLLQQEFQLDEPTFQTLIEEKLIQEVPGIRKHLGMAVCQRCFNQEKKYFGKIPSNGRDIVYCRKCIMMGRVSEIEALYHWAGPTLRPEPIENACAWDGELTPLQGKASDTIINTIKKQSRLLISAVWMARNEYVENTIKNSTQPKYLYREW